MEDLFGDLPQPERKKAFDGKTYEPGRDYVRLNGQMLKVFQFMQDARWHTLREIADAAEGSEAAVSARLRDLRKVKYGNHTVEREHVVNGLFRYRLVLRAE